MRSGKRLLTKVKPTAVRFQALADPHRLAILALLSGDELWVRDLVAALGIAENLLAHHLKVLLASGWITKTRAGRHSVYRIKDKAKAELDKLLEEIFPQ